MSSFRSSNCCKFGSIRRLSHVEFVAQPDVFHSVAEAAGLRVFMCSDQAHQPVVGPRWAPGS